MKLHHALTSRLPATLLAMAASILLTTGLRAADHGDAPALAQDQGADIADLYLFLDPTDNSRVILIGTFHGFIVPGEASNFGVFDPTIKYHFEIFDDHVNRDASVLLVPPIGKPNPAKTAYLNKIKANRTIDVTFSARVQDQLQATANDDEKPLQGPATQTATVTLGGFTGLTTKVFVNQPTTAPNLSPTATPQVTSTLTTGKGDITFFAGEVDDPFFFDIPAFSAFIKSKRETGNFDESVFSRGRDTFAGYNCLAIALSIPVDLLKGSDADNNKYIGADFMTQRYAMVKQSSAGQKKLTPAFVTIDRMGNPGVNVALIPFDKKNDYNGRTAKIDASLSKAGDILSVLKALGVDTTLDPAHLDPKFVTLAQIAVLKGDILILDRTVANSGPGGGDVAGTGFGTTGGGRRLKDDVIDTVLTVLKGSTLKDNVNANDVTFQSVFPFLAPPHQPLPRVPNDPAQADTNVDDGTRN